MIWTNSLTIYSEHVGHGRSCLTAAIVESHCRMTCIDRAAALSDRDSVLNALSVRLCNMASWIICGGHIEQTNTIAKRPSALALIDARRV